MNPKLIQEKKKYGVLVVLFIVHLLLIQLTKLSQSKSPALKLTVTGSIMVAVSNFSSVLLDCVLFYLSINKFIEGKRSTISGFTPSNNYSIKMNIWTTILCISFRGVERLQ